MSVALDPVTGLLNIGSQLIDRLLPDPAQRDAAKLEMLKMQQSGELAVMTAQTDINKIEAGSSSLFVAGWRPAVGWACVAGCSWNWVGLPVSKLVADLVGIEIHLSSADLSEMMPVLMGMLGLGALRTYEKVKHVAR